MDPLTSADLNDWAFSPKVSFVQMMYFNDPSESRLFHTRLSEVSCSEKVTFVYERTKQAFFLLLCCAGDLIRWAFATMSIKYAFRNGLKGHIMWLITTIAAAFFCFRVPFGYMLPSWLFYKFEKFEKNQIEEEQAILPRPLSEEQQKLNDAMTNALNHRRTEDIHNLALQGASADVLCQGSDPFYRASAPAVFWYLSGINVEKGKQTKPIVDILIRAGANFTPSHLQGVPEFISPLIPLLRTHGQTLGANSEARKNVDRYLKTRNRENHFHLLVYHLANNALCYDYEDDEFIDSLERMRDHLPPFISKQKDYEDLQARLKKKRFQIVFEAQGDPNFPTVIAQMIADYWQGYIPKQVFA